MTNDKYTSQLLEDGSLYISWTDARQPDELVSFVKKVIDEGEKINTLDDETLMIIGSYMGDTWDSNVTLTQKTLSSLSETELEKVLSPPSDHLKVLSSFFNTPYLGIFATATDKYSDQVCQVRLPADYLLDSRDSESPFPTNFEDMIVDYIKPDDKDEFRKFFDEKVAEAKDELESSMALPDDELPN